MKKMIVILIMVVILSSFVSAFNISGTVYTKNGSLIGTTYVNVTVRNSMWTQVNFNSTKSNSSGYFSLSLDDNSSYFYDVSMVRLNEMGLAEYVGKPLPSLPYMEVSQLTNINYYLDQAGTINITARNSSGEFIPNTHITYVVKDQLLSYSMTSCSYVGTIQIHCRVPLDRNYSIMIYPSRTATYNFVPVSYDWSNFSSTTPNPLDDLSSYNATKRVLHKQFNVTQSFANIWGYFNYTGGNSVSSFNDIGVVPVLLEPSNNVDFVNTKLPRNSSAWDLGVYNYTDTYTPSTGFYNISVPYAAGETVTYLLLGLARNGSTRYMGVRNVTVGGHTNLNFTLYGMLGVNSTINQTHASTTDNVSVNASLFTLQFINSTNESLSNISSHTEVTLDYSDYGAIEFTYVFDLSNNNEGSFNLPLINETGIKEINVFSSTYAPKTITTKTVSELNSNLNITMKTFNPGAIPGQDAISSGSITIAMYKSNSSCDTPNPTDACLLTDSSTMASFNPMSAVLGGADLSLRMGVGDVLVQYNNVDLLASGPPDAAFEENSGLTSSDDSFEGALKFGSGGPKIYDNVFVSLPYSVTAGSGLNENNDINVSIPSFYDDDWNVIWNVSTNGTNASNLAANHSHYLARQDEWNTLMNSFNCTKTESVFNKTTPCFVDTTNDRIWVRLPHFSGTSPTITGSTVSAASTPSASSSSGGGGGGGGGGGSSGSSTSESAGIASAAQVINPNLVKGSWEVIESGKTISFNTNRNDFNINEVLFTLKNQISDAWISIEKKEILSENVKSPPNSVYESFEITKSANLKKSLVDKFVIGFRISKDWLIEHNINKEDVAMYRYGEITLQEKNWVKLETILGRDAGSYVYYTAETPGFSYFVIAGEKTIPIIKEETIKLVDKKEIVQEQPVVKKNLVWFMIIFAIGIITVIILGIFLYPRK